MKMIITMDKGPDDASSSIGFAVSGVLAIIGRHFNAQSVVLRGSRRHYKPMVGGWHVYTHKKVGVRYRFIGEGWRRAEVEVTAPAAKLFGISFSSLVFMEHDVSDAVRSVEVVDEE